MRRLLWMAAGAALLANGTARAQGAAQGPPAEQRQETRETQPPTRRAPKKPVFTPREQAVREYGHEEPDIPSNAALLRKQLLNDQMMVRISEATAKEATSPQVRNFAKKVIAERKKHIALIEKLADQRNLNLETEIEKEPLDHAMDAARAAMVKAIPLMHGPEIDRAYLAWLILEQDRIITELSALVPYLDQTFSGFAKQSVPTLRANRREAYRLLGTVEPGRAQARRAPPRK